MHWLNTIQDEGAQCGSRSFSLDQDTTSQRTTFIKSSEEGKATTPACLEQLLFAGEGHNLGADYSPLHLLIQDWKRVRANALACLEQLLLVGEGHDLGADYRPLHLLFRFGGGLGQTRWRALSSSSSLEKDMTSKPTTGPCVY